ncbi:MAG: YceI family protein [Calditrichaeota bacterium]|nr:YceI family protein [Calditrichota bacterium]
MKLFALLILCACSAGFAAETFTITQANSENLVSFTSDAPLEEIVGKTRMVSGSVSLPDATSPGQAEIHVDMASLDTGLSLRNKHMRENHLETDTYPEAVFTLSALVIPGGTLTPGARTEVNVAGTLALHGQTRVIKPSAFLTLAQDGKNLTIESSFSVLLQDYQIKRPEFLVMKLSEEQKIDVKLVATR